MPPSGESVNTAMLDALDLSECLIDAKFEDLQTAIAAYENRDAGKSRPDGKRGLGRYSRFCLSV
jgi:hypothetical protein